MGQEGCSVQEPGRLSLGVEMEVEAEVEVEVEAEVLQAPKEVEELLLEGEGEEAVVVPFGSGECVVHMHLPPLQHLGYRPEVEAELRLANLDLGEEQRSILMVEQIGLHSY
jgi:hypothetical protein